MKYKKSIIALIMALSTVAFAEPPDFEGLFKRTKGWTGADGTYSLPLGDESTLWGFSDTFFGQVTDGVRSEPFRFVNNSLVIQSAQDLTFLKAPAFQPPDRVGWFWLFDGLSLPPNEGQTQSIEFLLGQFRTNGLGGAFGFEQCGLWWARFKLEKENAIVVEYRKLPFYRKTKDGILTFGSAITEVGPWAYIYGIQQRGFNRNSVVARAPKRSLGIAGTWQFFNGQGWQPDPMASAPLFEGASVEYSVHQSQSGDFVYVGSAENGMSETITARRAPAAAGPWSEPIEIGRAIEHKGNVFCYNAKAHPELSQDGKILVSYNVNTTDLNQVVQDANIYRPRFFWWQPPSKEWLP